MTITKKAALTFAVVMMVFAFSTSAMAASCSNAKVLLVGPNTAFPNNTAIQIQCVSGMTDWTAGTSSISMMVQADIADQILATSLTSISLGKNVYIYATTGALNGVIYGMYLRN
ncbi:hypothetical protein [Desulfogranum japonicum]|uniref:hypothetical protein n=1 Tax=Desulfogranum japonicum TaxID=231447 RepID=UPI00048BD5B4|nr:hypothetical protein [Desulfogranum japonicum]